MTTKNKGSKEMPKKEQETVSEKQKRFKSSDLQNLLTAMSIKAIMQHLDTLNEQVKFSQLVDSLSDKPVNVHVTTLITAHKRLQAAGLKHPMLKPSLNNEESRANRMSAKSQRYLDMLQSGMSLDDIQNEMKLNDMALVTERPLLKLLNSPAFKESYASQLKAVYDRTFG